MGVMRLLAFGCLGTRSRCCGRCGVRINEDDCRAQLEAIGLMLPPGPLELAVGGRARRCRVAGLDNEKRGWYRLSEWVTDEGVFLVGTYGIWHGDDPGMRKVELSKRCQSCGHEMPLKARECPRCGARSFRRRELSEEQRAALKARYEEDRRRALAEREAEIARAAEWAGAVWRASRDCSVEDYDYFARKHLDRTGGARIFPGNDGLRLEGADPEVYRHLGQFAGALVLPLCDGAARVYGVQFVLSRERHMERIRKTGRDKEFWPPGMGADGKYWMIGGSPGTVGLIAEGYATAMSLHMATGLSVAVAYSAGQLLKTAQALRRDYKRTRWLICADDDWLQKCSACGSLTPVERPECEVCGAPHRKQNTGVERAREAALAVSDCHWVRPVFAAPRPRERKGLTDYNDLHVVEGLYTVQRQVEAAIEAAGWGGLASAQAPGGEASKGSGDGGRPAAVSFMTLDDLVDRFVFIDDSTGDFAFDHWTRDVVRMSKVIRLLPPKARVEDLKQHPVWRARAVYIDQIGFDPGGEDSNVVCNRWRGWSDLHRPPGASCELQLELLRYLCSGEPNSREVFHWMLCWMAYPLQHPGAKLKSAVVIHGPQGSGKSMVFESYARIYGEYGVVLNQGAIEDRFNADWVERKLFVLADEIVARSEMHHLKNLLKTLITGEWVRVNPKNVAAHRERNHMNIVFASNEAQPVVLENDDRRHLVIWTPPKLGPDFYAEVMAEIESGGVAALRDFLLAYDTGEFRPWTLPPMTHAKQDLIDVSSDSVDRFLREWQDLDIAGVPFCPCGSSDLYRLYLRWCRENGERFPRSSAQFLGRVGKLPGWSKAHKDRYESLHTSATVRQRMVIPPDSALVEAAKLGKDYRRRDGESMTQWLSRGFFDFRAAIDDVGGGD